MPYSGPASSYGTVGQVMAAYFEKINAEGGINGRKITFISYDDGFSTPKTVEQTRKLVEGDEVLFVASSLGTAPNVAVQKYLNSRKVPQLFVVSGATRWGDPKNFPWTIGWQPSYQKEGALLRASRRDLVKRRPRLCLKLPMSSAIRPSIHKSSP